MLEHQGNYSRLQKFRIECKTCGVSDSFYSSKSVNRFRQEHVGHELLEGNSGTLAAVREDGGRAKLLKVLVELVTLPTYSTPVFTITGIKEDLKSAFVQVIPPNQRDQVNETLEKGKYLDSGSSDTIYVWEPRAISFSEDARLAMSFGLPSSVGKRPSEPNRAPTEPIPNDPSSTSGDAQGIQIPASGGEQSTLVTGEISTQAEVSAPLALPGPTETAASPSPDSFTKLDASSPVAGQATLSADAGPTPPEREASPAPSPQPEEGLVSSGSHGQQASAVPSKEVSQEGKVEEDNYLLVSKSWYIEKGPKNMSEAVRISRILRPFRWQVEPAYTIGVMVDGILSVETANGEIGGDMTKQIECAGYKLSRVSVEKGKAVAWFKREESSGRGA